MEDLIKALSILLKYDNPDNPTHYEHDIMYISEIDPDDVSAEDIEELKELGFNVGYEFGFKQFYSYKFGSS